ncbi:MAG TPA: phospholipid carrier-dependent glycosyltransferase [Vicinamibacteria bacterium]|jgi:dolichyl-phosphate-mannose--protein O-mannosyl transferase|nr:phospholipid carrier-dependent glycosyltransferase [Vicinamibacteria bacterium]
MALPPPGPRRDLVIALLLAAVAAVFRFPRLGVPGEEYFDEVYHAKTALQYLNGQPPIEWVHPPTAKLLIAVPVWFFGYYPAVWRTASAIAGVLLAPVFFLFARRVLATERAAVLASVLLLCDGVYLVQSRIAMTNIFAVLFQVASALFILRAALRERLGGWDMVAAGICLGLALSTRWTSLWAAGYLGGVLLVLRRGRLFRPRELALTVMAFGLFPVAIYLASYLPWAHQQHFALLRPAGAKIAVLELVRLQKAIWRYHANLQATHPYFSKWYTWPWLGRPTWYYFNSECDGGCVRGIVAIGNPALWWVSVPVTLWALVTGARDRDPRRLFTGLGFCALYLPWGISPRTLNYSHYLFEAIPYACLSLGLLLDRCWDDPRLRHLARGYVVLVLVLFFYFLPFLIALRVPADWFNASWHDVRPWTWFRSWV